VTAKRIAVKKYVVELSETERERLNTLINTGKHPARQLTRARILLKADSSEAGDAWSDSQIAIALDTSVDTVARTRQQLVEEGLEAVLVRKHSPASARTRIFDGAAEAKPNFTAFSTQVIDMIPARLGALSTRLPTRPPAG
jgi:hypothetical protein